MYDIKQLKLSSQEEILCEVIEYVQDDINSMIVRNAMEILTNYDRERNEYFYVFKPWMHYIESNEDFIMISSNHVVGISNPTKILEYNYKQSIDDMHYNARLKQKRWSTDQLEGLQKIANSIMNSIDDSASTSNIIKFPVH